MKLVFRNIYVLKLTHSHKIIYMYMWLFMRLFMMFMSNSHLFMHV